MKRILLLTFVLLFCIPMRVKKGLGYFSKVGIHQQRKEGN